MRVNARDEELKLLLRDLPREYGNRYSDVAARKLLQILFYSLSDGHAPLLRYFFPNGAPSDSTSKPWKLADAQGAVDGAEYTEAARGKPCGHIFREGEATYQCRTCAHDETCVLCAKCFESSDHEGHQITVSHSEGRSGCCDCGDPEAWVLPLRCSIHSPSDESVDKQDNAPSPGELLPERLRNSIRVTISRTMDYICDIFSCSPEQMRTPKNESAIRENEVNSRLSHWYGKTSEPENDNEFALILWNDEKHTLEEVEEQIARACRISRSHARDKAREVDAVGRSIVAYSRNVTDLIEKARILAQIKVTITIRSARDTFREQMCETIIEWLSDIAGCSVGQDHRFLMHVVCEELLGKWRIGSPAFNLGIAQGGLIDKQQFDDRLRHMKYMYVQDRVRMFQRAAMATRENANGPQTLAGGAQDITTSDEDEAEIDEDEDPEDDQGEGEGDDEMELDEALLVLPDEMVAIEEVVREDADEQEGNVMMAFRARARDGSPDILSDEPDTTFSPFTAQNDPNKLFTSIPKTPNIKQTERPLAPPHWLTSQVTSANHPKHEALPLWEHMHERVRIDHLVFYDMRMWKNLRDSLRQFYITTVVTVPTFKRILSLRFAALYTHLSQLFLLADREADHSIIHLSLQMLTAPSITEEVVKRSNFYTRLLAILYTFLTKRQVGEPEDVDPHAAISFEQNSVPNRRIYHVFNDLKYLLKSKYVQDCVRTRPEFLLQFLDFAKLFQGICPNRRVLGQHIEYESDSWLSASILIKDVTRITRQICKCFRWTRQDNPEDICRAIRQTAKATIINSLGTETERFQEGELTEQVHFKTMPAFRFEEILSEDAVPRHVVVDCTVDKALMSFHHALHYTLSWLIEAGKSMSSDQLESLLKFSHQHLQPIETRTGSTKRIPELTAQHYLLGLFDIPLRLCAWIAQMRAGMWVRNGITLRHQLSTYRGVPQRDVSYQRDIFMLQTAFVICSPATFLASAIDRFGMTQWVRGSFVINEGYDDTQMLDVAEDFLHLLIVILSDRTLLLPTEDERAKKSTVILRDLIHTLCFKPLTFSRLAERLPDKIANSKEFQQILNEAAIFRPPEGLADSGTWRLKDEYFLQLDPYYNHYSKSQREEAETLYRTHTSKLTGEPMDQVFFEPRLQPIQLGVFRNLSSFTQTPLFSQLVHSFLRHVIERNVFTSNITVERIEAFLHVLLHLVLVAILEDRTLSKDEMVDPRKSFVTCLLETEVESNSGTVLSQLFRVLEVEELQALRPRVRFVLGHIHRARPERFAILRKEMNVGGNLEALLSGSSLSDTSAEQSLKKQQAQARQAKVMASFKKQQEDFMHTQNIDWGIDDNDDFDEDMDLVEDAPEAKYWDVPSGTCILCQAETSDKQLYGLLGFVMESHMFRTTDMQDADYVKELFTCPRNLDRSADSIRPFGVAGQNMDRISKVGPSGSKIEYQKKGLGKGFPRTSCEAGPIMTGCGHIMHLSCFYDYVRATERRHSFQYTRNHPEDIRRKEFICPLCKALGNTFLPVVWKPRMALGPPTPENGSFDTWLATCGEWVATTERLTNDAFRHYAVQNLVPSFLSERTYVVNQEQISRAMSAPPDHRPAPVKTSTSAEIAQAYRRLRDTLRSNAIPTRSNKESTQDNPPMTDALVDTLGYSIAAIEIAYRGAESETVVFVDSISPQTISQLRALSETVTAYLTMGTLHRRDGTLAEIHDCFYKQFDVLFNPRRASDAATNSNVNEPLLSQDLFIFGTACCVYLAPGLDALLQHILQLCYLAEIIKIVVTVLREPAAVRDIEDTADAVQSHNFSTFVQSIIHDYRSGNQHKSSVSRATGEILDIDENPNTRFRFDQKIRKMIDSYALPFLRKCALLMHLRYGIDYSVLSSTLDPQSPELERLSAALKMPSIDELIISYLSQTPTGEKLRRLGSLWISDWRTWYEEINAALYIGRDFPAVPLKVSHPGIYELVALPENHDTLSSILMSRRCPSTGRELTDPCVCLFCGAIFCGQATCCSRITVDRVEGGCYRHQKTCGSNTGMFLNVRKCAVLFLNRENGSWFPPPYLDEHGEIDMGLKRRHQLFLHQKRYDRLFRDVWLGFGGGIPSAVARKLEAEINTGGWQTM